MLLASLNKILKFNSEPEFKLGKAFNKLTEEMRKLNYSISASEKIRKKFMGFYEPFVLGRSAEYILRPVMLLQKYAVGALARANRCEYTKPTFSKLRLLSLN